MSLTLPQQRRDGEPAGFTPHGSIGTVGEGGGGHDDARAAAMMVWSHHWAHPATRAESEIIGTFDVHWEPPMLDEMETDEGFSLNDLMQELGRLELKALGRVTHGDVLPAREGAS